MASRSLVWNKALSKCNNELMEFIASIRETHTQLQAAADTWSTSNPSSVDDKELYEKAIPSFNVLGIGITMG
ncbi:unnamed protein product [Dovyalis caffra]|uniref:Uncharacterized protein n=1 Tax=Dovyalis caffra TaxID=77055 RepID=A0AAV1SG52_9ROSI|nr:unnamed protein product [Dovyalis caffra]